MQIKIKALLVVLLMCVTSGVYAAGDASFDDENDIVEEEIFVDDRAANEEISANAIDDYQVEGSLFQQITDLEQEKVLMQLEKERAQLNLDLDRLAAEKIKLHMEIDTLSGRAEQQQQEFETERVRLEAEAKRLEKEKEALDAEQPVGAITASAAAANKKSYLANDAPKETDIAKIYKLINVFGAGAQLQATIQDLSNGQNKRISVGKDVDGFIVKSISLDEGVVFIKDGETQTLNVGVQKANVK
jgi:type IV pilus biogenesis protein PilP